MLYVLPDGSQQKLHWEDTLSYAVPAGVGASAVVAIFDFGCGLRVYRSVPIPIYTDPAQITVLSLFPSMACMGTTANWYLSGQNIQSVDVYLGNTLVATASMSGAGVIGSLTYPSTLGNYTYMFVARGCGGNDTAYQTVTVQGSGTVAFFTAPASACVGSPVTFTGPSSTAGVTDINWDFGDGTFLSGMNPNSTHTYTNPGTYTVYLSITSTCGFTSYSRTIKVYGGPPSLSGLNVNVTGATITYSVSATDYDSVKWFFGDGNTALGLSGTHTYSATGTYTVRVIAYNPCGSDTLTRTVTISTASLTGQMASVEGWVAYPNPAQDVVVLSHPSYQGPVEVRIFDVAGRVVRTATLAGVPGELRVSGLPAGLYSVHLRTQGGLAVLRLLVE
ncbi:MAG: PKD domain-containing protein [Bacteroidetes bacterium]|nr:MAG: PKD domain-containing protein [Bacteroidota bacterium]